MKAGVKRQSGTTGHLQDTEIRFLLAAPARVPTLRPVTSVKAASRIDRFEFERRFWALGLRVAGVDEAGRGPLAGPVMAAAAVLPPHWDLTGLPSELEGLNDSKQLTPEERERFFAVLTTRADVQFAVAGLDSQEVDRWNILEATHRAMDNALAQLRPAPQHVLVDGLRVKSLRFPQTPLVEGDARSYSIAAASVITKVTRDRLMVEFDRQWPAYGFAGHKGYCTPQHLAAIEAHGPCPIHRRSFSPFRPVEQNLL